MTQPASLRNKQAVVDKDRKSLRGFGQFCSPLCLRAAWPRIRDLQAWAEAVTKNGHSVKQLCSQRVRATATLYHVLIATAGGSSPPLPFVLMPFVARPEVLLRAASCGPRVLG